MRAEAGRTGRLTAVTSSNDPFLFPPRFAGGGPGRRNSGFRHVDDCRRTHETVGRIEKPGEKLGSIFRVFTDARFSHFVHPLPFGIFYVTIEDSPS
jgi:hypothetical protein